MGNEYLIFLYYIFWGLLVSSAISFLISGLDDLFFDLYYWTYYSWRLWILRHAKHLTYEDLIIPPEKRIAVMIPCWHEAGVIEVMLKHNVYAIDYEEYDLFVGVYKNDPNTVAAVESIALISPHVHIVLNSKPGPTTKADNLNVIYTHILEYEKLHHKHYDIFVLHDSEDIIHPLSFKLYNFLMPKNQMVQIPIFPIEIGLSNMTHWTYNSEFSEIHTKDIIVREKIGGLVPSAGVGTAFSRASMDALKSIRGGLPFSVNTLTEDYSTSLQIRLLGFREIFVLRYVYRTAWKKKYFFFGPPVAKRVKEFIATRALFPMTYMKAVRQKTRWILGISFQEWTNTGWSGNFSTIYTLIHDRKTIFTHLINGIFFILTPFWILYAFFTSDLPEYPTLQDLFEQHPWVWTLIIISSFLMLNRILQRAIAVWRVYGFIPALWSIPLILYGNIINLHALIRSYFSFIFSPKSKGGSIKWDKTDHSFPIQNPLIPFKLKLGDLLLQNNILTKKQLSTAINEQNRTGAQLGQVLLRLGYLDKHTLKQLLAKQYELKIVNKNEIVPLDIDMIPLLTQKQYDKLLAANCFPIQINGDTLTVAITDPSNEIVISRVLNWVQPYKPRFVLFE